ncbi:hypothetical protein JVT61DRAFT_8344 [Boletus reticuloceps]|uniref:FAD-binding oxidoreductase/transferase type 4 C-terminal domain-containing protein n=1 Tax=Boletus reticuloceps TaxID=495285 RepID=A0A8I2Z006_9AGAM|nr:hypothetical protein JVT61DRAFT_8344 [Boletus reticuloceps]
MNRGVGIRRCYSCCPLVTRLTPCVLYVNVLLSECVELCDSEFMRSANLFAGSQRAYPESDCLFFKFQGPTQASIQETAQIVKGIVKKHGATGFELARNDKEAKDLWAARKNALYSGLALLEGARGWSTDVWSVFSRRSCGVVDEMYRSTVFQSQGSLILSMRRNKTSSNSGLSLPL